MELIWRLPGVERRGSPRMPVQVEFKEHIDDRPIRSVAVDLSEEGMAVRRPIGAATGAVRRVGVEMVLPGTGETLWAEAQMTSEEFEGGVPRIGLRFLWMVPRHRRLIQDFLADRRLRALETRPPRRWLKRLARLLFGRP